MTFQFYNQNITFRGVPPPPVRLQGYVDPHVRYRREVPALHEVRSHMCEVISTLDGLRADSFSECVSTEMLSRLSAQRMRLQGLMSTLSDAYVERVQRALRRRATRRARVHRVKRERWTYWEQRRREEEEKGLRREEERRRQEKGINNKKEKVERSELSSAWRWCERLKLLRTLSRARTLNRSPDTTYNNKHLDTLISMWECKIRGYVRGEAGQDERGEWGERAPQRDFPHRDLFIHNRRAWDVYVCAGGSALPLGWVAPT